MALLFCDGFDHYETADVLRKWTAHAGSTPVFGGDTVISIRPIYARAPGGQGYRFGGATNSRYLKKTLAANYATLIYGFNWYPESIAAQRFAAFVDGGTSQVELAMDASGHLLFTRAGATLATSTNVFSAATWYHIECKATIHNSAGAYEVRVNGSATGWIPAASGADTTSTANAYANEVWLGGISTNIPVRFDDAYVLDTSGAVAADFIGPQKIYTAYPSGAGNSAQWAGNYASNFANVNETLGDGDATFNQDATAGHIDLFAVDDVPAGTIAAVQHVLLARQDAGAQRTIRPKTRISSTNYSGTTVNTAGSYLYVLEPASVSPATSVAWTDSELAAAEFGYELVS